MPAPDVYGDGMLDPLPEENPFRKIPYGGILYATDREPAGPDDEEPYYLSKRGSILRLGVARIQLGETQILWPQARQYSLLKNRTNEYPLKVTGVDEWGILGTTVPFFTNGLGIQGETLPADASQRYVDAINAQLAESERKDVILYVHGFKVTYENPILVATELWHFLGYQGAFIAYAWPSTPSQFAYIRDSDTSAGFARNFRQLLELIATKTDAERIHIIGYSNGTRLVSRSLEQLALKYHDTPVETIQRKMRIGNVLLIGSDVDRTVFSSYITDGLLRVPKHLAIYISEYDKALGLSKSITRNARLGQMFEQGEMSYAASNLLKTRADAISVINVSEAPRVDIGSGHDYFTQSPWASSDILMTLAYDLSPDERGLVRQEGIPLFKFPPDYIERLWTAVMNVDDEFAKAYQDSKENTE